MKGSKETDRKPFVNTQLPNTIFKFTTQQKDSPRPSTESLNIK